LALVGNRNGANKKHSIKWKEKISRSLKGHSVSKEARRKMSKIKKGNKNRLGKFHTIETREKISKSRIGKAVGKNNGFWKGGISEKNTTQRQKEMQSFKYKQWRVSIFERDEYTCQVCRKVGGYLMAHHIKGWAEYPQLRYNKNNGITLCEDCHRLTTNYGRRAKVNNYERNF
jgi:hypothetical protein